MTREATDGSRTVAVVSGAGSGIDRALAVRYPSDGRDVVIGTPPGDPHDPGETLRPVETAGVSGVMVEVDVRDSAQVDELARVAHATYGRIDYAVANAGVLRRAPLAELTDDVWDDMLSVDLTGVVRTVRSCSPFLGEGGSVVAISSVACGVHGWEDHESAESEDCDVSTSPKITALTNATAPGPIEPPSVDGIFEDRKAEKRAELPLGRFGRPEEVAPSAVLPASSPAGDLYVGQTRGPNSGDVLK